MANLTEPLDATAAHPMGDVLRRLRTSEDIKPDLLQILDIAIGMTGADTGTLQRFDENTDCLTIVASRGLSSEILDYFGIVRRETNTTCAAALMRRMRVFVGDISTSYLFVSTRELDVLCACGIAAAQSTPLISNNGRLWGVFTTHFYKPQIEDEFDPVPLDQLAIDVANTLEQRETLRQQPATPKTSNSEADMKSTAKPIPFGRSMLREHRHVCAFFSSAMEEYDALLPFICDGINCGQRAFHVLPAQHRESHLMELRNAGVDVEKTIKSRQLEVAQPEDTYLKTGRFNKDAMLALVQTTLNDGTALGFPLTRMIAHAEMVVDDWKSGNEWVEYEMRLNEFLPKYDDPVICTYDANLLTAPFAVDILRTHPVVIIGGILIENSFFTSPQDFIREVQSRTGPTQPYRA